MTIRVFKNNYVDPKERNGEILVLWQKIMMSQGCKVVNMECENIADGEITLSEMECTRV